MANKHNRFPDLNRALYDIMTAWNISSRQIKSFAPVYYPVAIVEMELDEKTFEDFEGIQLAVLRFVGAGVTDPSVAARSMGIRSVNYISNVMQMLKTFGLTDDSFRLTASGRESVEKERKISVSRIKQRFQLDALNGVLIRTGQSLFESSIIDADKTAIRIGKLDSIDAVSEEALKKQLEGTEYVNFIKHRSSGGMNPNVVDIRSISVVGIKYAGCCLAELEINGQSVPVVFGKRYNPYYAKTVEERFSWQPFSFEEGVWPPRCTAQAVQSVTELNALIKEKSSLVTAEQACGTVLARLDASFESPNISYSSGTAVCASVTVCISCFKKFSRKLLSYLDKLSRSTEILLTDRDLYGKLVRVKTEDETILSAAEALKKLTEKIGYSEASDRIESHFNNLGPDAPQGKELFETLTRFLTEAYKK